MSELKVKCPECGAEPGVACGIDSHPERIELAQRKPKKAVKHKKIHAVPKKKRRAA